MLWKRTTHQGSGGIVFSSTPSLDGPWIPNPKPLPCLLCQVFTLVEYYLAQQMILPYYCTEGWGQLYSLLFVICGLHLHSYVSAHAGFVGVGF